METPLVYILISIILILIVALGTVSWYTIKLLIHRQELCSKEWKEALNSSGKSLTNSLKAVDTNWQTALEKCRNSHVHMQQFELFKENLDRIINKMEHTLETLHISINKLNSDILKVFKTNKECQEDN